MTNTERTDAPSHQHTAASLADVLEKHYSLSEGAQLFLSGHEWGLVVSALRSEIGAPGELESLRVFQRKIEEAEARCCPEDVGFEEYIAALKKRLAIPSNMEDRFLIQECATWIRRLAARIKQYQPQLAKKAVDWLHRKEIQGSPLRDAETISDSETLEVRKEREGYETAIALSYECDRLREELAKARSAIEPSIKSALQWAAQWIEDSAKGADQSVVSFAQNMAMTLRSNGAAESVRSQP